MGDSPQIFADRRRFPANQVIWRSGGPAIRKPEKQAMDCAKVEDLQISAWRKAIMPLGTLDVMKLDGTFQVMFEQNAGGTFVARVEEDELVPFMHEEMRVDLPVAEDAAKRANGEGRIRIPDVFLEENNLHAVMDYMEEED
jgi:hypothetical protein